mgnify:CR=1 FL=1
MADSEVKSVVVSETPQEYTFNGNTIKTRLIPIQENSLLIK